MNKYTDDLKRLSHRMMEEKEPYYKETKKYFNTVMKGMEQTDLIEALHDLNIFELKQCLAAGVPGHAMHEANKILRDMKADIKLYIEKQGTEAIATVEVDESKEEDKDVDERICTSEKGRDGDSETLGSSSPDTR